MSVVVIENSDISLIYQSLTADQKQALAIHAVAELDRRRGVQRSVTSIARETMGLQRFRAP